MIVLASTSITVRMEEGLKKQVDLVFDDMGLNMTTAFTIFAKAVVRQNRIPFDIAADPLYSEMNQARLRGAISDLNAGKNILEKTVEELLAMDND